MFHMDTDEQNMKLFDFFCDRQSSEEAKATYILTCVQLELSYVYSNS